MSPTSRFEETKRVGENNEGEVKAIRKERGE